MTLSGDTAAGRLAIIAGGGLLPSYVAEAARAAGENPVIVALKDESDRRWEGYDHAIMALLWSYFFPMVRPTKKRQTHREG